MTDWTSPSTRSDGDLITEAIYNNEIINNEKHLYERRYAHNEAYEITVADTGEQSMGVFTIPANEMGAYGMVCAEWFFRGLSDANPRTIDVKVYLGGNEFAGVQLAANIGYFETRIRCWVANAGATNSQHGAVDYSSVSVVVAGTEKTWQRIRGYNTAAVDTTSATTLYVGVQLSAAAAGFWVQLIGSSFIISQTASS